MSCREGRDEGERNVVCHESGFLAIYCGILSCSYKQQATAGSATDSFWVQCAQCSVPADESASSLLTTPGTSAQICKASALHFFFSAFTNALKTEWNPSAWDLMQTAHDLQHLLQAIARGARAPWESKGLGTDCCCQHHGTCTTRRENL